MSNYKEIDGTSFTLDAKDEVCKALNAAMKSRKRVRIYYGNQKTGECNLDEFDIMGYVGRSTGKYKIPILCNNSRSMGGSPIADSLILRITMSAGKEELYKADNFHFPQLKVEGRQIQRYNEADNAWYGVALCDDEKQAKRLKDFWLGKRNTK